MRSSHVVTMHMALAWPKPSTIKHAIPPSMTDCATTSRMSQGSVSSSASVIEEGADELMARDECARVHTTDVAASPSYVAHARGIAVEGLLKHAHVDVHVERGGQLCVHAIAEYHGSSTSITRFALPNWRYRHAELARLFVKEMLFEVYRQLCVRWGAPVSADRVWRRCMSSNDENTQNCALDSITPRDTESIRSTASFECAACTEIGARVTDIEWGRGFRWGGDDEYNPTTDGAIHVEGMCIMPDQRPPRPVWEHDHGGCQQAILTDVAAFALDINAASSCVAFGTTRNAYRVDENDPWRIAQFECRQVQIRLPAMQ